MLPGTTELHPVRHGLLIVGRARTVYLGQVFNRLGVLRSTQDRDRAPLGQVGKSLPTPPQRALSPTGHCHGRRYAPRVPDGSRDRACVGAAAWRAPVLVVCSLNGDCGTM